MVDKPVKTKIQVQVDPEKCTGCGTCSALAPETFELNEDFISEVINQDGNSDEEKLNAAQSCPTEAIEAVNIETNEKIWPK